MFLSQLPRLRRAAHHTRRLPRFPKLCNAKFFSVGRFKDTNTNNKQSSTTTDTNTPTDSEEPPPKRSKWENIKYLFYEYRYPFIAYYGVAYVTPIVPFWLSLQFFGVDGVELLQWVQADKLYEGINDWNPKYVNFFIAMEMNELLEFFRIPIVLSTTPKVAKWWRSRNTPIISETPESSSTPPPPPLK